MGSGEMSPGASSGATRAAFAAKFLGVAMQQSPAGEDRPVRVATTGVFEFDCEPSVFELGDLVGLATDAQTGQYSQKLVKVATAAEAIGRVAKRSATSTDRVIVEICSTVMKGRVAGTTAS